METSFSFRKRIFCFVLTVVFLVTNHSGVSFASPMALSETPQAENSLPLPLDLTKLEIPKEIGRIEEVFQGKTPSRVILVQDAHGIPDAQRKVQSLIEYF